MNSLDQSLVEVCSGLFLGFMEKQAQPMPANYTRLPGIDRLDADGRNPFSAPTPQQLRRMPDNNTLSLDALKGMYGGRVGVQAPNKKRSLLTRGAIALNNFLGSLATNTPKKVPTKASKSAKSSQKLPAYLKKRYMAQVRLNQQKRRLIRQGKFDAKARAAYKNRFAETKTITAKNYKQFGDKAFGAPVFGPKVTKLSGGMAAKLKRLKRSSEPSGVSGALTKSPTQVRPSRPSDPKPRTILGSIK